MFIPDPNFFIPGPGSKVKKEPEAGSATKNFSILLPHYMLLSSWQYYPEF
jgi:hypothetical protein